MRNLFLILFLLFSSPAFGAIAYDSVSTETTTNATGIEWAHTVIGTSNTILIVGVITDDVTDSDRVISGVTFGASPLTHIRTEAGSGADAQSALYYLVGATGTETLNVTFDGTVSEIAVGAIAFTGVDQASPIDANNGGLTSSDTMSTAVTTVADNAMVVDAGGWDSSAAITVDASQTQRVNNIVGTLSLGMSHEGPNTPAGSVTMSWTKSVSAQYSHSVVSLKPSTDTPVATSNLQAGTLDAATLN